MSRRIKRSNAATAKNELDFGYPTRLWDAVDESVDKLEPETGRKVVVVFTDGDDTSSKVGLGNPIARCGYPNRIGTSPGPSHRRAVLSFDSASKPDCAAPHAALCC